MFKISAALLLFLIASNTYAQNKATIKGSLADSNSNAPIEFATIAVVNSKDTTLISYTLSDKKGGFNLSGIPIDRPTKLIISYVGYPTHKQHLELKAGEIKDFGRLLLKGTQLKEVVIQGERSPIVVKKDTIEFNTEAFKTRPNAVVEELLRELPGVQVNTDGSILVNGKKVSKLLIDGKEFFGNDPLVATRNLDADLLDQIQIYDDRENDPGHKISAMKVTKIINLKLKSKIKKSTIGKFYGGGGSRDRYETGGILSNFRDTLQVSLIGLSNNLNKTGFSQDELYNMGGFNRSGGSGYYDGTFGGRNWGGNMEKVTAGGLNINNNYEKKLKSNLSYFYTNTNTTSASSTFNEQNLADLKITSASTSARWIGKDKHAIGGLIEWYPDTLNQFKYQPQLNLGFDKQEGAAASNTFNTLHPKLSDLLNNSNSKRNNSEFSHKASYYRRLRKEGESINIQHSLYLNKNTSKSFSLYDLKSYVEAIKPELFDRLENNNDKSNNAAISVDYSYPFTETLQLELNAGANYANSSEKISSYDKNPENDLYNLLLVNQSSDLSRTTWSENLRPQLSYTFAKEYRIKIGVNVALQNVKNKFNRDVEDQHQKYFNLFPAIAVEGPSFSISYTENIEQPRIAQIQPIIREYTQLQKYIGNPDLKPKYNRELSGNIYKYSHEKQINFNMYGGLTFSENNTIEKNTIDANGASTTTPINKNGSINGYVGGHIGKQFKKSQDWQIGLNNNFSFNMNRNAFYLNQDEGIQYNYYLGAGQGINFNYQSLFSIKTKYDFNHSITTYKMVNYKTINNPSHNIGAELTLRWPKRIIIDSKYNFNYNPKITQGFSKSANILNLAVTIQMLKKDRGQLKLSVFDLLDQSISVYQYANENSVGTSQQQILKRYFLATYQYKITMHKGK
ncbi:outer membrane beta-barrel protein [Pedobacter sp. N36a]|uniref:outer membrane beta-barrel protein n=1 Tax=Pedobacter sp. N36a TaxID=2767996 RepID=UPI001656C551|nr:outer membrane beta-barrel protein [Pedobacter sp. N36a]MBC8987567.1 outer membrane beta-barrel protein [Pedobacter sp. N36a]